MASEENDFITEFAPEEFRPKPPPAPVPLASMPAPSPQPAESFSLFPKSKAKAKPEPKGRPVKKKAARIDPEEEERKDPLDNKEVRIEDFANKEETTYRDQVSWVLARLDVPARDLEPSDAPSAGAWSLLKWARGNRKEFIQNIWHKVAGKHQDVDKDERAEVQQTKKIEAMCDILDRVHKKAGLPPSAQGSAGQLGVPPQDPSRRS